MPAPKSSTGSSRRSGRGPAAKGPNPRRSGAGTDNGARPANPAASSRSRPAAAAAGVASIAEQLANRVIKPLDLVILTRSRIEETLDEAAARGRVTRSDANDLVAELVRLGRQQTDDFLKDIETLAERGRDQLESAGRRARRVEPVDRLVRSADRARRTVGVGPTFPILGYDELTAAQVRTRITGLTPRELRTVREYERRHANRKSVLEVVEKALD